MSTRIKVEVIRTNGDEEKHEVPRSGVWPAIKKLLGCQIVDRVNLRDGRVMIVDDEGWETETIERDGGIEVRPTKPRRPLNDKATAIYRSVTRPNDHQIAGDVAIVVDADFA
jgi:hypothetical protein